LAASTAVLSVLRPGDEVVAAADLYGGTYRLLERVFKPWGLNANYTDDPSPEGFARLIGPKTKLVWVETPTNPLLQILDIAALAELAHRAGALLAVDNTFASPYLQQPISLGADLVVHSTTKYLGGHSDVVGGAVVGRRDLLAPIAFYQNAAGGVPGPFDAYLTLRGLKTLELRMQRHCANARRLAAWLAEQPQVEQAYYPGLPAHPGHELARRQMRDFGGMVSLRLKGGAEAARRFLTGTRLFSLAESLGGVESLVCHPATMTHASIPAEVRLARGVDEGLIRLSVGVEDVDDLQEDLRRALA
jgi:cystathionine beta-lyase/cystathionine gamma-synthase